MKQHLIRLIVIALLFLVLFIFATLLKSRPVEEHGLGAIPSNLQKISTPSAQSTARGKISPTQKNVFNADKNTYVSQQHKFSLKYPAGLKPLELANGVVSFLPQEVYDNCRLAQESKDFQAYDPCFNAQFNLNGIEVDPAENYAEYSSSNKDVAILSTYTDTQNRIWNTGLVLGQVYNFDAFGTVDSKLMRISFQYGFDAPLEIEVITFFNEILSTIESIN